MVEGVKASARNSSLVPSRTGKANCLKIDSADVEVPGTRAARGSLPAIKGRRSCALDGFAKYWLSQSEPVFRVSGPIRFGRSTVSGQRARSAEPQRNGHTVVETPGLLPASKDTSTKRFPIAADLFPQNQRELIASGELEHVRDVVFDAERSRNRLLGSCRLVAPPSHVVQPQATEALSMDLENT